MEGRFVYGHSMRMAGPSQCGKTTALCKLLAGKHYFYPHEPRRVMWVSGSGTRDQKVENFVLHHYPNAKFLYTVPEKGRLDEMVREHDLWVFDDLAAELRDNPEFTNFFTKTVHHKNCILVYLTQNAFEKGKDAVTRTRNCAYQVYFKNKSDVRWINVVGQQLTENASLFRELFKDVTPGDYDCLLVDNRANNPSCEQFWANPFSDDANHPAYMVTIKPINEEF
jgi:hypothetical protein